MSVSRVDIWDLLVKAYRCDSYSELAIFSLRNPVPYPPPQDYFSAAKVHEIPSSAECWGADKSHQLSYGGAIMLAYEIYLSYDYSSKQR